MTKYIIVTGGVISGIGKGVIASSTGTLLKSLGLRVTAIKIDPYLNIDAGLMSPLDHGILYNFVFFSIIKKAHVCVCTWYGAWAEKEGKRAA